MKKNRSARSLGWVIVFAAALAVSGVVLAHSPQEEVGPKVQRISVLRGPGENVGQLAEGFGIVTGEKVTGAPFSAQAVIEKTQTLANGSHITQSQTGALYRDSEGRIRREMPRNGSPEIVMISDPVSGTSYRLNVMHQTATQFSREPVSFSVSTEQKNKELAEHRAAEEREMAAKKMAAAGAGRLEPTKKKEDLGTQTIEGVQATGIRLTITVPPGKEGNDQSFDIVTERWYSAQLQAVILVKHSDPRSGETVFRLTNINLGEPAQSLFTVPAGFTMTNEGGENKK